MNRDKLLDLMLSPVVNLGSTYRYAGLHLSRPESVSDHIVQVGIISLSIAKHLEFIVNVRVDYSKVGLNALIHDIDESLTSDVPRPIKYYNSATKEIFNDLAKISVEKVGKVVEIDTLLQWWNESKSSMNVEGLIVHAADIIQCLRKTIEEVEILGNMYMLKVAVEITKYLKQFEDNLTGTYPEGTTDYFKSLIENSIDLATELVEKHKDTIDRLHIRELVV